MEHGKEKTSSSSLHAHGDGTYHTQSGEYGGKRTDHESIGAALIHLAKAHAEGDHMHIQGHDEGYTTHHVKEGGKVQGPNEHKTMGAAKKAVAEAMDSEGSD